MSYIDFNDMQIDALREVANIGAGNAATALSQLLQMKIDMTVPSVNIDKFNEIFNKLDGEKLAVGILVRVLCDIPGNILFIFDKSAAVNMINKLLKKEGNQIDEFGNSVLCEIGNIISSSFINAIAKFTNLNILPSVPAINYDMVGAILSSTFIESNQFDDFVLDIEANFFQENKKIEGHFYYIPKPGSLEKILNSVGLN